MLCHSANEQGVAIHGRSWEKGARVPIPESGSGQLYSKELLCVERGRPVTAVEGKYRQGIYCRRGPRVQEDWLLPHAKKQSIERHTVEYH